MRSMLLSFAVLLSATASAQLHKIIVCDGTGYGSAFHVKMLEFSDGKVFIGIEESKNGHQRSDDTITAELTNSGTGTVYKQTAASEKGAVSGFELFISAVEGMPSTLTMASTPLTMPKQPVTLPVTCASK